mmetsp:Transcript_144519/g.251951  ORF Transcript_144519/g.251951 Transcript_144519/m.251951 type:complete len:266 (-) Transcript_144519:46-843(-)
MGRGVTWELEVAPLWGRRPCVSAYKVAEGELVCQYQACNIRKRPAFRWQQCALSCQNWVQRQSGLCIQGVMPAVHCGGLNSKIDADVVRESHTLWHTLSWTCSTLLSPCKFRNSYRVMPEVLAVFWAPSMQVLFTKGAARPPGTPVCEGMCRRPPYRTHPLGDFPYVLRVQVAGPSFPLSCLSTRLVRRVQANGKRCHGCDPFVASHRIVGLLAHTFDCRTREARSLGSPIQPPAAGNGRWELAGRTRPAMHITYTLMPGAYQVS